MIFMSSNIYLSKDESVKMNKEKKLQLTDFIENVWTNDLVIQFNSLISAP